MRTRRTILHARVPRLMVTALIAIIGLLGASNAAYAGPSKPPTPDKGSVSPLHVITCDYWAGLPYWTSGTTVAGKAYWSCSDSPDVQQVCALIQVKDKSDGSWVSTGSSSTCTSSTTRASNVTDYGNCIGSPGNWTWSYRVYYTWTNFHGNWTDGEGYGSSKSLSC